MTLELQNDGVLPLFANGLSLRPAASETLNILVSDSCAAHVSAGYPLADNVLCL
jgi:hypothetical protein